MTIKKLELELSVEQILNSATIDQIMNDNPDLSYDFVCQLLVAQAEVDAGMVEPYEFG